MVRFDLRIKGMLGMSDLDGFGLSLILILFWRRVVICLSLYYTLMLFHLI